MQLLFINGRSYACTFAHLFVLFSSARKAGGKQTSQPCSREQKSAVIWSALSRAGAGIPRSTWQSSWHIYGGGQKRISATCTVFPNMLWKPLWRHILSGFCNIWVWPLLHAQKRLKENKSLEFVWQFVFSLVSSMGEVSGLWVQHFQTLRTNPKHL